MTRLAGWWRIVDMELWVAEAIDLMGPGFVEFGRDRLGRLEFIAVEGQLGWREVIRDRHLGIEFTWESSDDGDPVTGRGWADEDSGTRKGEVVDIATGVFWKSGQPLDAAVATYIRDERATSP